MTIYHVPATGPLIAAEADANDLIGEAWAAQATLIAIPVERLSPDFFWLGTGLAGAILQKCTNYNLNVAIVGDISRYTEQSGALRDFIRESNRRGAVRFVASHAEL